LSPEFIVFSGSPTVRAVSPSRESRIYAIDPQLSL
jgi:hypothetical protein